MSDAIFADPQLAEIYDLLDSPERPDLSPYFAMADEFHAQSVIDLGCGTGVLACRLAAAGKEVTGIDPAEASVEVARRKEHADRVQWIVGDAEQLKGLHADLITMTGNVAQVFVTDEAWMTTLQACHHTLNPNGRLVFEVRDPAKEVWKSWNREQSYKVVEVPAIGTIESWTDLINVQLPLVSFRHTFLFRKSEKVLASESTLRFRSKTEITNTLLRAQLTVESIRDASDRPGLEFVFVAHS